MTKSKIKSMKQRILLLSFVMGMVLMAQAQTRTLTGKVTGADDGSALPGVNVSVKGTSTGTITDIDGNYKVDVSDADVLVFSYIGYATQEATVGGRSVADIVLAVDAEQLEEVVVTALGIEREKKSLGYAVTELGGKEVSEAKENTFVNSLSGKVAGLQVSQNAGGVAGSARVVLRGNSSLTGDNNVLYVVDGIPFDNTSNGLQVDEWGNNMDYGNGIGDINPEDIETISVLKGATAAALYGSRATNGVILITTKKGKSGSGIGVSYTSNVVFEEAAYFPELQNTYGQGADGNFLSDVDAVRGAGSWGPEMAGQNALLWTGEVGPYTAQPDNMKEFFDLGKTWTNTIALDGGNEQTSFRLGYTNVSNSGIVPNSGLDRNSFTVRVSSQLTPKLSADAKVSYVSQKVENRPSMSGWGDNVMLNLVSMPRNTDMDELSNYYDADGNVRRPVTSYGNNPYYTVNEMYNEDTRNRVYGVTSLNYNVTDWLKVMLRGGTDYTVQKIFSYTKADHPFNGSVVNDHTYTSQESNFDFLISANKDLSSDFSIGVNLGGNLRKNKNTITGYKGSGYSFPGIYNIVNTNTKTVNEDAGIYDKEIQSIYASGQFAYLNAIFIDWTARNDWSSTLPTSSNSYFYPSVSTSVVISDLIDGLNGGALSFLKVRASFAQTGNDTEPYKLSDLYKVDANSYLGLNMARLNSEKANPNLVPEKTNALEAGLDIRFLEGRFGVDFAVYKTNTTDQIMPISTARESGYISAWVNAGEVENKGWEAALNAEILRGGEFTWTANLNLSSNETKVIELDPENGIETLDLAQGGGGGVFFVSAVAGGNYGEIRGFGYQRNDQGQIIVDAQGLPLATEERMSFGDFNPDLLGGLTNSFTYKNFALDFLISFRKGGKIMSVTSAVLDGNGGSERSLEGRDGGIVVPNSVTEAGDPNTTSATAMSYWGSNYGARNIIEDYVKDGSFVKFKEVTLSYNLPSSVLANTPFNRVSVGVTGRNLFFLSRTIKDFDPEVSGYNSGNGQGIEAYALPATRSYGFNLKVNF